MQAHGTRSLGGRTLVFVGACVLRASAPLPVRADEIHRFNKAVQDLFLPAVESGVITLMGATTENPAYELNAALLSRCRVFVLDKLDPPHIDALLRRALAADTHFASTAFDVRALHVRCCARATVACGRCPMTRLPFWRRCAMGMRGLRSMRWTWRPQSLQPTRTVRFDPPCLHAEPCRRAARHDRHGQALPAEDTSAVRLPRAVLRAHSADRYDRDGDNFYNMISAVQKSIRGSDQDAGPSHLSAALHRAVLVCTCIVTLDSGVLGGADAAQRTGAPRPGAPARAHRLRGHWPCRQPCASLSSRMPSHASAQALVLAVAAAQAVQLVGRPEGDLALIHAAAYLARAPKSNALEARRYMLKSTESLQVAYGQVVEVLDTRPADPVPLYLRSARTKLARDMGLAAHCDACTVGDGEQCRGGLSVQPRARVPQRARAGPGVSARIACRHALRAARASPAAATPVTEQKRTWHRTRCVDVRCVRWRDWQNKAPPARKPSIAVIFASRAENDEEEGPAHCERSSQMLRLFAYPASRRTAICELPVRVPHHAAAAAAVTSSGRQIQF